MSSCSRCASISHFFSNSTVCCRSWLPNTVFLHAWLFLSIAFLFFMPITFMSPSFSSLCLLHSLTLFLVSPIVTVTICFGIFRFCISWTWSYYREGFYKFYGMFQCSMSFISLFGLILQLSLSFTGPYIFLTIFHISYNECGNFNKM